MIRYLKHSEIDLNKWDECINASPNGIVYAYSWYLNIVAGEWDALVEEDYESVFPVFPKKKFGISYSLQPKWTQQLGLFSTTLFTPQKCQEFLMLLSKKFRWVDMNLNSFMKLPENHGFKVKENQNYVLSLMPEYLNIEKGYSENHKRNLKKNTSFLNVTTSVDHEEIVRIFRENRGKNITVLDEHSYVIFNRLIYHARSNNVAKIYSAFDETNTLLGGAIFLIVKERAVMIFSAVSEEGRTRSAMHILIDSFIRNYSGQNIILDFEGSNDVNLARFYSGFGAKDSPYMYFLMNRLFLPTAFIKVLKNLF